MSNPWIIDDADFYELETHEDQVRFLLRYAILAPSGHNTQPWSFRITPDGIEVFADTSRRLLIVDRNNRELLMSVGAAITNFRVAAAHFGFETAVAYETRSIETLPIATVFMRETCAPDARLAAAFSAIRKRHTNRELYDEQPLEPAALQVICDFVDANPETLRLILPRDRERVAESLEQAEKALLARPAYRAELAEWVGSAHDRNDGLTAEALGMPRMVQGIAPWLIRNVDAGELQAHRDVELMHSASLLLMVVSDDDQVSLVKAGEMLEMLLLTITRCGLQCSFLNAPIQMDATRDALRFLSGNAHEPQLLLRVGSAKAATQPTARRPVESVIA